MSRHLILPAFLLAAGLPLLAQQGPDGDPDAAQGYVDNVFHHSQVDSINLYNGQLTVPIAVGPSYPIGPKLKLQLVLTYGSRVREYGHPLTQNQDGPSEPLAGDPALGIGWTFTLGAIKTCSNGLCYVGPDGSERAFDRADSSRGTGYYKTSDASQLSLRNIGYPNDGPFEMWDGDGNHHVFGWHVSGFDDVMDRFVDPSTTGFTHDFGRGRNGWYLTLLTDPFGNGYSIEYRTGIGPCWTYSTSCTYQAMRCPATSMNLWIPQTITLPMGSPNNVITISPDADRMISAFTFPVSGAGTATWTLGYQQQPISYTETCGGSLPYIHPNLRAIQSIQLPNAIGSYQFSYSYYLTHMQVPTGGTVDYQYSNYHFYHGRLAALNQTCQPKGPDPFAVVEVTGGTSSPGQTVTPPPNAPKPSCSDPINYLDEQYGVVRRTETTSGTASVTDYVQYAFPFGEHGTSPASNCDALGRCGPQNLTVVVFPPDVDGRRRAKGVLFFSAPKNPNQVGVYAGERTGAEIEERVYDSEPTQGVIVDPMPVCGGAHANLICADRALRVTQRTFEYDIPTSEVGNRRLLQEKTYYGPTSANSTCATCAYHLVANSNSGSSTWEGNGRHYNVETHSGNLGGDFRQIITTWTPLTNPWFPNLRSIRTESDGSSTANQYFDYKLVNDGAAPNGFLRGTLSWDPGPRRVLGNCRYQDPQGNVSRELTVAIDWPAGASDPQPQQCTLIWPSFPALSSDGKIFGTHYTYANGQKTSARWINGSADATWLKYDVTRDPKTGWITSSRDTAGLQTSYLYDSLGRPTSITPPGEAATAVTYDSTTQTTAVRNGGTDSTMWSQFQYDGFGRTIRERRLMPGSSYAKRFTNFDRRGYAYFQSEWVADALAETISANVAANCSFSGSSYPTNVPASAPGVYRACFDPYGRPQLLTGAGYSSQTSVSRSDSRQSTPAYYSDTVEAVTVACVNGALVSTTPHCSGGFDATTTTTKDAFGHATSVVEPSGDATTYGYDILGKLRSVSQGAQSGSSARTFGYDLLGLLRQEKTPEKGIVNYDSVGPFGNVLQQTEPGGLVISRRFDYATRLASVSSNEGRTYVTNTYDEPGHGSAAGKLTTSASTNWALSTPSAVTDSFSYSGLGGRLSSKTETLGGSASLATTQSFNYNSLGLLNSHSHPRKFGDGAFTVSYTFNAGLPVTELVNGATVVSGISYGPSGALASYTTNNGPGHAVTTTILPDGNLPRPSRIQTSGASSNFDSGVYGYDGAGNIRAMGANNLGQTDTFVYDLRSRLTTANLYDDSGAFRPETFQYDRYGNTTSRSADGSNIIFSVDPATNRLVTTPQTQYDLRGNLTLYGVSKYAYDGLSRQTSFQVTGSMDERYLYDATGERMARVIPGTTAASGGFFYSITPCRLFDSRVTPPSIPALGQRTITAWNACGISTTATALAANVTSVNVPTNGYFRAYPAGLGTRPLAWVNAFRIGQATATQAIISINGPTPGALTVYGDFPYGTADVIIDIAGYFAQQTTSTSDTYNLTLRDPQNRLATKYNLTSGVSTVDKDYVYVGNQLVATWQPAGGYSFFMTDHLGTPRLQTDVNATMVTRAKNRAFGLPLTGVLPQQGPDFAAMEKDSASGNHYDHARFYTSWLGRFQVPDLLGGHVEDPQSWNRYSYARNNPLSYVDPDGRAVMPSTGASQAAVDYQNHKRAFDGLANAQTLRANWSNGNYWFEVATAATNAFLSDPTLAILPSPMALEVPGEVSLLKLTSGNFRQNLMRFLGKSAEEVAGHDAHHMLPQAERLAKQFSAAGLNVHDPKWGAFLERGEHLARAAEFNADWTAYLSKEHTAEEIDKYARVLAAKYDIKVW